MARRTIKSMLAAVLLCLVMLPATALAAVPSGQAIYVGEENVTSGGYWTTSEDGQTITSVGDSKPSSGGYIHYDADNNTLTLHNATIKESMSTDTSTFIPGTAIGVLNESGDAKLTITLEGTNTIEDVSTGIFVLAHSSSTGDATLTITGSGSLDASGSFNGIMVQSNSGDATLTIQSADVTLTSNSGNGVTVQAGSTDSSGGHTITLSVEGGSLTASGSTGISFDSASSKTVSATKLTVRNNAIVRANDVGSKISNVDLQIGKGNNSSGGIVFDGNQGTVYGSVELQEDLTIGKGETLTIPEGASLNTGSHEVIVNGGTLTGGDEITGTVKYAPTITTASLPNGTVNEEYSQTLAATGSDTITWSVTSGALPAGLSLSGNTISGTPTATGSSTFTVTAANPYGSDSKQLSITVSDATAPTLTAGTATRTGEATATVSFTSNEAGSYYYALVEHDATAPTVDTSGEGAACGTTEQTISLSSLTGAGAKDIYIVVKDEAGNVSPSLKMEIPAYVAPTYGISAVPGALNFGSAYVGYSQPAAQMVTVTNAGNQAVTLMQPTSASYEIGKLSAAELKPNDAVTFTVRPKPGLGAGAYAETLTISGSDGVSATISLSFSVSSRPYIPPTPSGPDWDDVAGEIADAVDGGRVVVDMDGETELPGEVLEALAGHDVTLVLEMGDGVAWEIYGGDVPEGTSLSDVDMGVELGTSGIPVDVVDLVTGEAGSTQVTLAHEGPFGFELTLVAPVGEKYEGLFANAYRYDAAAGVLRYEAAGVVDDEGAVRVRIDHASSWLLALDSRSHALPFADASEGQWYSEPVRWAWLHGVMIGYADGSGLFGTGDELTRAQMAAVLHNAAGRPEVEVTGLPSDCDASAWYAQAVAWALEQGIFHGYGDGSAFGPDDPLTREQAACVLHNAAGGPASGSDLSSFSDSGEVSEWAEASIEWDVAEVDLHGPDGLLEPARALTRAEAAALMANLAARD